MTSSDDAGAGPLDSDERAELTRLRAELATRGRSASGSRRLGRAVGVWLLVVLCGLLALLSVTTRFVRGELLDSEHYVSTVAPLASDPAVRGQVADSVTDAIVSKLDLDELVAATLAELTELTPGERPRVQAAVTRLAPMIAGQAESLIHSTVTRFVASDQFRDLWITANRKAHQAVVAAVTGETERATLKLDDGVVAIELGPIISAVKTQLAQQGFGFADKIPAIDKEFVVFSSPQLARSQQLIRMLDRVATALPWLAIACAAAAVVAAGRGRRWRTLTAVGFAVVIAMGVLALGIAIGRAVYLTEIPVGQISPGAARVVFDTAIEPLRIGLRAVAAVGLVIAIAGFAAGGSRSATALRSGIGTGMGALADRRGDRPPSALESWAWQARVPLRIAVVVAAAAVVMFWPHPSGMVVLWTVLIAAVVLAGLEILSRPGRAGACAAPAQDDPASADASVDTPGSTPQPE